MNHLLTVLRLEFGANDQILLLDFNALLYDFELLHDFSVICNLKEYQGYLHDPALLGQGWYGKFWTRRGRPIRDEDRLRLLKVTVHSPSSILLGVGVHIASKALVPLIDSAGRIADWRFNRQKARAEALKAQFEAEKAEIERETTLVVLDEKRLRLAQSELELQRERVENQIVRRLERNPLKLTELSIDVKYIDELRNSINNC